MGRLILLASWLLVLPFFCSAQKTTVEIYFDDLVEVFDTNNNYVYIGRSELSGNLRHHFRQTDTLFVDACGYIYPIIVEPNKDAKRDVYLTFEYMPVLITETRETTSVDGPRIFSRR